MFTPRDIDDLLAELMSAVHGDARNLVYAEHASLILHYCIATLEPSVYHSYLKLNAYPLLEALTPESVSILNYSTLRVLPELLDEIVRVEPSISREKIEELESSIQKNLDFYSCVLGLMDEKELSIDMSRQLRSYSDSSSSSMINLVLVSTLASKGGSQFNLGKVLPGRLSIEVTGEGSLFRKVESFISFDKRIREENDPFSKQLEESVSFAERSVGGRYGRWELDRIPRVYRFGISDSSGGRDWAEFFTGGSAGLAFALISMADVEKLSNLRLRHRIRRNTAFTGGIDREGNVLPVDDADMPLKTRAVFHSPCSRLVLPEQNMPAARKELEKLLHQYPGGKLELRPVSNIAQVYSDSSIVERFRTPAIRVLGKRARIWRKHLFSAAAVFLIFLFYVLIPRLDHNTVRCEFDGTTIDFYNRFNHNFHSFSPGYFICNIENNYDGIDSKSYRLYDQIDVTGDGENEILFISVASDSNATKPAGRIHTHLFDNSGKLMNHIPLWDSLLIKAGEIKRPFADFTYCQDRVADLDEDGLMELVIASVHIEFSPSLTAVVSFKEESYRIYIHGGHLKRLATGDFNRDGRQDMVLGGVR
ncbi:MAG: hypothetical protein GF417_12315, partial [Candidatus Latescibacteria bacterium]|nr:hypothetical protein [bacterium]MBD3425212.1 hypothetical protein [Candidatus Latescibacterota bacterium]